VGGGDVKGAGGGEVIQKRGLDRGEEKQWVRVLGGKRRRGVEEPGSIINELWWEVHLSRARGTYEGGLVPGRSLLGPWRSKQSEGGHFWEGKGHYKIQKEIWRYQNFRLLEGTEEAVSGGPVI